MSRNLYLSLITLVLLAGGAWFWWNSRPEQQVGRKVDEFLEAVRFEKLSLKKRADRHGAFRNVFAQEVSFSGPDPFPGERLKLKEILGKLDEFHGMITLCEIIESERSITVDGNSATADLLLEVKAAAGPNFKRTERWQISAVFEKMDRWRIISMNGQPDGF